MGNGGRGIAVFFVFTFYLEIIFTSEFNSLKISIFDPVRDSKLRSLIKGISWRCIGTIDTFIVALFYFRDVRLAAPIAGTEVLTKIILYYLHERGWNLIKWGRKDHLPSHTRSVAKGLSWRIFGTMDTMFISLIISGNPLTSIKIGMTEVFTKIILFYFHERLWAKIKWGRLFQEKVKA